MSEDFSWEHSSEEYISLYRQLISVKMSAPPQ